MVTRVLVADDSKSDRLLVTELLKGLDVATVEDGVAAIAAIESAEPDIVVTDLVMPEMDGLQLVAQVRKRFPKLPVILMTSQGSEEIAVKALKTGAASYVPKSALADELRRTIDDVIQVTHAARDEESLQSTMRRTEFEFVLGNDARLVPALSRRLQEAVLQMGLCGPTECNQVGMALHEALNNASEHGNLETSSKLREGSLEDYFGQLETRRAQKPYCDRRIHVRAHLSRDEARFTVRDEGPGFDPSTLPDPRDPANLEKLSGRGILLIRTFMDQVTYNDKGCEVTMILKRRT